MLQKNLHCMNAWQKSGSINRLLCGERLCLPKNFISKTAKSCRLIVLNIYLCIHSFNVYLCVPECMDVQHLSIGARDQETPCQVSMELKLQAVMSHSVGTGYQTWVNLISFKEQSDIITWPLQKALCC